MTKEMQAFMVHSQKRPGQSVKFNKPCVSQLRSQNVERLLNINRAADSLETSPEEEHVANLAGWIEERYQDLIDTTEFLDSSRVKRID